MVKSRTLGTTYSVGDSGPICCGPARRGGHQLPGARAPRRQTGKRPVHRAVAGCRLDDRAQASTRPRTAPSGTATTSTVTASSPTGAPWDIGFPPCGVSTCTEPQATIGRIWPIFAGERGEYELAAGRLGAAGRLESMARGWKPGYMLPEQVWDENPPSGSARFPPGEGTLLGHAARLEPRPVRRLGLVHRRGTPCRAAPHRGSNATPGQRLLPERKSGRGEIPTPGQAGLPTALLG